MENTANEIKSLIQEVHTGVESLQEQVGDLNTRVATLESSAADLETKQDALRKRFGVSVPGLDGEKQKFSMAKAVRAMMTNDWSDAGFEAEVFRATSAQTKDMSTVGDDGGYLVPPEALTEMIPILRARAVLAQAGATIIPATGSPLTIPTQATDASAYWIAENNEITKSTITTGQKSFEPHQCAGRVHVSNRLLRLNATAADQIIMQSLAAQIALAIDIAGLRGSGAGEEPLGIRNNSGIATHAIGTNGGVFDLDEASEMEGVLEDANALFGNLGFIFHGKVKRKLKRIRIAQFNGDTGGDYLIRPMSDADLREWLGYPFYVTSLIPTNLTKNTGTDLSEVYFGNWADLVIAEWGGLELLASNTAGDANNSAFTENQTWIRAIRLVDVGVRQNASFVKCVDAET